jgi:hypothetical protein
MNSDQRIVQIKLQDAIGTIERTVEVRIDDEIVAPDIFGRAGTRFHVPTSLMGNKQKFFPLLDRIPRY